MKRTFLVGLILMLGLLLVSCAAGSGPEARDGSTVGTEVPAGEELEPGQFGLGGSGPLPPATQLIVGTFKLEGTENEIDSGVAMELLPLWKAYRALVQETTTASEELEGLLEQIRETMSAEQLAAIEAMQLTATDLRELAGELDQGFGFRGEDSSEEQPGIEGPGFGPGGGFREGRGGEGFPGGFPGGFGPEGELSAEVVATLRAERGGRMLGTRAATVLVDPLIEMLEGKANPGDGS